MAGPPPHGRQLIDPVANFAIALEFAKLRDDLARIGTAIGKIAELDENGVASLPLAGLIDEAWVVRRRLWEERG